MPPGPAQTGERRSSLYSFPNLETLKSYFLNWLPDHRVASCISDAFRGFRIREDSTAEENRLQLVKKCEGFLMRALMNAPPGGPGAGARQSRINSP